MRIGDGFSVGPITALSNLMKDQDALNFATAASCLVHSTYRGLSLVDPKEVERLMLGQASGRVER